MRSHPRPGARVSALCTVFLLSVAGTLSAQSAEWYEMSSRRQTDGIETLDADIEYAVGRLEVEPAEPGLLYRMDLRYDARAFEPLREWHASDVTGHLALQLRSRNDEMNFGEFDDIDSGDLGSMRLGLSREIPTNLSLGVMAAEARLELGGVALRRFVFRTGASETSIGFATPNPVRMDRLEMAAGAADFSASGLGNARFDRLEFVGAVGDVRLDFRGDWEGAAEADIRMGLGALRLTFPHNLGVRIEKRGILTSFESSGFEAVDGGYQTPNWDTASDQLTLSISAGFGDIDVSFTD